MDTYWRASLSARVHTACAFIRSPAAIRLGTPASCANALPGGTCENGCRYRAQEPFGQPALLAEILQILKQAFRSPDRHSLRNVLSEFSLCLRSWLWIYRPTTPVPEGLCTKSSKLRAFSLRSISRMPKPSRFGIGSSTAGTTLWPAGSGLP
jgi:hypothetical protein